MMDELTVLTTTVVVNPKFKDEFADWQAQLNTQIVSFPGFISLEISSPCCQKPSWTVVQRFQDSESLQKWQYSEERKAILQTLQKFSAELTIQDIVSKSSSDNGSVAEVFVTRVSPEKEAIYREWTAKIHQVEAKSPGFRGVYVQAPSQGNEEWMTLLQFDTPENLDRWLSSKERKSLLQEAEALITALESHRVASPYASWFAPFAKGKAGVPPVWKQAMIILLVLFPIVMLEGKFLSPFTAGLNPSLAMFIGNVISVGLLSWPVMPLALRALRWWLSPAKHSTLITLLGVLLVLGLYLMEIAFFWNLTS